VPSALAGRLSRPFAIRFASAEASEGNAARRELSIGRHDQRDVVSSIRQTISSLRHLADLGILRRNPVFPRLS
jgi:hypothetical protein